MLCEGETDRDCLFSMLMTWEERCYRQVKEKRTSCSPSSSRPLSGEVTLQSVSTILLLFWLEASDDNPSTSQTDFLRRICPWRIVCSLYMYHCVCISGGHHRTGVDGCAVSVPRPGSVFEWQAQWLQSEHALQRYRATPAHRQGFNEC